MYVIGVQYEVTYTTHPLNPHQNSLLIRGLDKSYSWDSCFPVECPPMFDKKLGCRRPDLLNPPPPHRGPKMQILTLFLLLIWQLDQRLLSRDTIVANVLVHLPFLRQRDQIKIFRRFRTLAPQIVIGQTGQYCDQQNRYHLSCDARDCESSPRGRREANDRPTDRK